MRPLTALNIAVGVIAAIAFASIAPPASAAAVCKAPLNLPFWNCTPPALSDNGGTGTEGPAISSPATKAGHPNCGGGDPGTHPGPHGPEGNGTDGTGNGRGPGPNGPQD